MTLPLPGTDEHKVRPDGDTQPFVGTNLVIVRSGNHRRGQRNRGNT